MKVSERFELDTKNIESINGITILHERGSIWVKSLADLRRLEATATGQMTGLAARFYVMKNEDETERVAIRQTPRGQIVDHQYLCSSCDEWISVDHYDEDKDLCHVCAKSMARMRHLVAA